MPRPSYEVPSADLPTAEARALPTLAWLIITVSGLSSLAQGQTGPMPIDDVLQASPGSLVQPVSDLTNTLRLLGKNSEADAIDAGVSSGGILVGEIGLTDSYSGHPTYEEHYKGAMGAHAVHGDGTAVIAVNTRGTSSLLACLVLLHEFWHTQDAQVPTTPGDIGYDSTVSRDNPCGSCNHAQMHADVHNLLSDQECEFGVTQFDSQDMYDAYQSNFNGLKEWLQGCAESTCPNKDDYSSALLESCCLYVPQVCTWVAEL